MSTPQAPNIGAQPERSAEATRPGRIHQPAVDIFESEEGILIRADMPGVDEEQVDVHVDDGTLSIRGQVSLESYEGQTPIHSEYTPGHFERRFALPSDLDDARMQGRMKNGVLELELPRRTETKPRRIPIEST